MATQLNSTQVEPNRSKWDRSAYFDFCLEFFWNRDNRAGSCYNPIKRGMAERSAQLGQFGLSQRAKRLEVKVSLVPLAVSHHATQDGRFAG